jgi:hypothetical protein
MRDGQTYNCSVLCNLITFNLISNFLLSKFVEGVFDLKSLLR